jgi:tripartite-type tricarboxylate transporter receptor subunit TctC
MKKIITLLSAVFIASSVNAQECRVVTQGPGGLTDQLFRIMEKHNPNFRVTYRISAFNVTQIDYVTQNPGVIMLSPALFYSKNNPRKDIPLEMISVVSSSNAAITTNKNITIEDFASKKLNVGIPTMGTYSHILALQLQQKNPDINIVVVPAKDAAVILKNGDLDLYIHTEPTVDTFVTNFGFRKLAVILPDVSSNFNGIQTRSKHFTSAWIHKNASPDQRQHVQQCLASLVNNKEFISDLEKTGSTSRLNLSKDQADLYVSEFISMLRTFGM